MRQKKDAEQKKLGEEAKQRLKEEKRLLTEKKKEETGNCISQLPRLTPSLVQTDVYTVDPSRFGANGAPGFVSLFEVYKNGEELPGNAFPYR